jgi:hypothetical protein
VGRQKPAAERVADIIEKHLEQFSEIEQERLRRAASEVIASRKAALAKQRKPPRTVRNPRRVRGS